MRGEGGEEEIERGHERGEEEVERVEREVECNLVGESQEGRRGSVCWFVFFFSFFLPLSDLSSLY